MKSLCNYLLAIFWIVSISGCNKEDVSTSSSAQTCPDEHTLAVYKDQKAIILSFRGVYLLSVDPKDIAAAGSFAADNALVPATALPVRDQVVGKIVLLSGRKKSCDQLLISPEARSGFGYKLEIDTLKDVGE